MGVLESISEMWLSKFIHEGDSLWGFPAFLEVHVFGLTILAGLSIMVSVRALGAVPSIPLKSLSRLFPFMWFGLLLTVITGSALAAAKATTMFTNPILLTKVGLIVIAVILMRIMQQRLFRSSESVDPPDLKMLAGAQVFLWVLIMVLGRLIAYSGTILGYY